MSEIYADTDDDALSVCTEGGKLNVPHHQSQVSIISMEDGEFSDDEKVSDNLMKQNLGALLVTRCYSHFQSTL